MCLFQLAPELLLLIFECLESSFFREDLDRLTICKQWLPYARTAFLRDIEFSPSRLRRLLSIPIHNATARAELGATRVRRLKDNIRTVALPLRGYDQWRPSLEESLEERRTWTDNLDRDLAALADILRNSREFRAIHLAASMECHPLVPNTPRRSYLYAQTLSAFLQIESLTVLELDTWGTDFLPRNMGGDRESVHICPLVSRLLPTLHRLRIRMRRICPDALLVPQNTSPLHLQEFIINLSLAGEPSVTSVASSLRCRSSDEGPINLRKDIEDQARALADRMISPKTVRVLSHILPSFEKESLDVLTGKRMILAEDSAWDDDGSMMDDSVDSETDLFNSESSSSDEGL